MELGAVGDVVLDRHREGVGLLEDHPDPLPDLENVRIGSKNVLAVEVHLPLDTAAVYEVVHPVECPQQGGLPAAGRADEGSDVVAPDRHVHIEQSLFVAIPEVEAPYVHGEICVFCHFYHLRFFEKCHLTRDASPNMIKTMTRSTSAVPNCASVELGTSMAR